MSSDGYFEDDSFDAAAFEQLDAIEAAHNSPTKPPEAHDSPEPLATQNSFYFDDIDDNELARLDDFIEDAYQGKAQPIPGPSRTSSRGTLQTTLFGDVLRPETSTGSSRTQSGSQIQRTKSTRNVFGHQAPKTKQWDQTAFAKSGLKRAKSKGKGKGRVSHEGEGEEEEFEFEQFPAPFVSVGPPPPMKLAADLLEAKHWIYPLNHPKRDYQYNIVKRCLFDNTIVALPTGLGKTFIAGVIMLNFYRWFPEGKVVFVAPTKPLVAQQIDASHRTCGIPGSDAAELTGEIIPSIRARLWKEKRVFYMTPQTLINDLVKENCDARDIILLVVDEAHKATGDYAYNQVVRFLMAKNPHFRLLALTATPGSDPDSVQKLIDGLHISHIEIRDDNSLDLKAYIHQKHIEQHVIRMNEHVEKIKDLLAACMEVVMNPLLQRGILKSDTIPIKLHSYFLTERAKTLTKDQGWANGPIYQLAELARCMAYLIEGTIGMCYTSLQGISQEDNTDKRADARKKKTRTDPRFQALMKELEIQRLRGFPAHPKMDKMKALVLQHFAEKMPDDQNTAQTCNETRAMVFVTFREAVDEVVQALNMENPLIRAVKFVGQSADKHGNKGLGQKQQLETIKKFKEGEFNVLVATSIGEEGLDIGEVDLIICYDAQKAPIRMLQRIGRTGRKRDGAVHVLLGEGREEQNWEKAKQTHKEVQKTIVRGDQFELYADVERLLPTHIKPECLEKAMEIQPYERAEAGRKGTLAKETGSPQKGVKRKRNADPARNMPAGASTGFVSVKDLLVKPSKKRKKVQEPKNFDLAGQDDDTDIDIESGAVAVAPRRTVSSAASTLTAPPKAKSKLKKAATMGPRKASKKTKKVEVTQPTSSQFSKKGLDDSDDMDIEEGRILATPPALQRPPSAEAREPSHSPRWPPPSVPLADRGAVIELDSSDSDTRNSPSPRQNESMAWLIDDDEDPDIEIVDSSPILKKCHKPSSPDESIQIIGSPILRGSPAERWSRSVTPDYPDIDDSVVFVDPVPANSPRRQHSAHFSTHSTIPSSSPLTLSSSPFQAAGSRSSEMLPPALPVRFAAQNPPEPSYPVMPMRRPRRHLDVEVESPALDMPPPSQRRLRRQDEHSPLRNVRPRKKLDKTTFRNPLYDTSAIHSGDEVSEGSSGSEEVESESDRLFLKDIQDTQVSPSYDQDAAYRQSLFTQPPPGARVPLFANRPSRRGPFASGSRSRRRSLVSSSPPRADEEPDAYVIDSFVVDDEADISYASSDF